MPPKLPAYQIHNTATTTKDSTKPTITAISRTTTIYKTSTCKSINHIRAQEHYANSTGFQLRTNFLKVYMLASQTDIFSLPTVALYSEFQRVIALTRKDESYDTELLMAEAISNSDSGISKLETQGWHSVKAANVEI